MPTISYARHQFPPAVIRHAVRLYVRFTLSYRDVEDLPAERGLGVSRETVRRWVLKSGPVAAGDLEEVAHRLRRDPPPLKWSALRYGFEPEEDRDGGQEAQA